jgi:hypothetical protein
MKYLLGRPRCLTKIAEGFMRIHYLISIAAVNVGLLVVLFYSFNERLYYPWLPLTAVAYYFFYGRDLILSGYIFRDLCRVYAFNLLLIPINLAGVFKSVQQMITGRKIPFHRTPKVSGRTISPVSFLLWEYALLLGLLVMTMFNVLHGYFLNAVFGLTNAGFLFYALSRFVGFKESIVDLSASLARGVSQFRSKYSIYVKAIREKANALVKS